MKTKMFDAKVKAVGLDGGLEEGQFEAIVSVFGNEDSFGDVVLPGAFKNDLQRWSDSGDPLPVIWSHDWTDPFAHVGVVVAAEERAEGLWVRGEIRDMDTNPKAAQVYNLLKGRRVKQFSFAYDIVDGGWGQRDGSEVYELRELKVHEVGPCLLGVNQETELLAVKARALADAAKAGRELDLKAVAAARDVLSTLLAEAAPDDGDEKTDDTPKTPEAPASGQTDEPSQADEPQAKDEEPHGAKSEEPAATSAPRRALAVALITNLS